MVRTNCKTLATFNVWSSAELRCLTKIDKRSCGVSRIAAYIPPHAESEFLIFVFHV